MLLYVLPRKEGSVSPKEDKILIAFFFCEKKVTVEMHSPVCGFDVGSTSVNRPEDF